MEDRELEEFGALVQRKLINNICDIISKLVILLYDLWNLFQVSELIN